MNEELKDFVDENLDNNEGLEDLEMGLELKDRRFIYDKDKDFVAHTLATYIKRVGQNAQANKPLYYSYIRPALEKMMLDLKTDITIFYYDISGEESLMGFTATKCEHLIFAYIKSTYRGLGLYKKLRRKVAHCTHLCFVTQSSVRAIRLPVDPFFFAKEYL